MMVCVLFHNTKIIFGGFMMNKKMTQSLATLVTGVALFLFIPATAHAQTTNDQSTVKTTQVMTNNPKQAPTNDDVDTNDADTEEPLTPAEQAELDQALKDQKLNDQANNANTRLQPWYTGSSIMLNLSQITYYLTGSVSNVVGQGTAIIQTGTNVLGTVLGLLKP